MLNNEQTQILEQAIILLFKLRNDQSIENWETERERQFEKLNVKEGTKQTKLFALKSTLRFTKKEILQMPKELQKYITIKLEIPVRQKPNGVYEARFRAHGFNICTSSTDFDKLKPQLLNKFLHYKPPALPAQAKATAPPLFSEIAEKWLELKHAEIKDSSYKFYAQLFRATILPILGEREISNIKQSDCQQLINSYFEQAKYRTALKIFQTLNAVFNFALGEELIDKSPMRLLKPPKYEEQNGIALTLEEERNFLRFLADSNCIPEVKNALLILLYTGIRRSELASIRIENGFISVINAKTRKGFQEKRRLIPITPMLTPYLSDFDITQLNVIRPDALTQAFKRLMPSHHLHELRHTFITRCQECGVAREIVSVWAGHAADNTQTSNVYTHFSREFMLNEAQKVIYNLK